MASCPSAINWPRTLTQFRPYGRPRAIWRHVLNYSTQVFQVLHSVRKYDLDYRVVLDALTAAECNSIIKDGIEKLSVAHSELFTYDGRERVRDSGVSWVLPNPATSWLFERVASIAANLNKTFYEFDLDGSVRAFQLTRYDPNQHYSWHRDLGANAESRRKLTISVQLSSPDEYDGGTLQFFRSETNIAEAPKTKASLAAFPSWMTHRVTPVTRGIRWSLVTWLEGPPFR